jgi:Ca-activated chloride channel family protein
MSNRFLKALWSSDAGVCALGILFFVSVSLPCASAQSSLDQVHITSRPEVAAANQTELAPRVASLTSAAVIRKDVDLVLVPVTVTDTMQRLVVGLRPDNFQLFENKKPQRIQHFSSEDAPVSLGIIVDASGSMANKMDRVREAVKEFCASSNSQDEFFMITFSDEPRLMHDFTDSPEDIESKMLFTTPKGRTTLLDAIYMGLKKMREAKFGKKALLIISDGGDNHSRYTEEEVKSAVKESDVMIYAIGTFDRYLHTDEEKLGPELLSNIADTTGGRAFILDNMAEMPTLAHRIGTELRTQYVLGYHPENPPHDGKWRKVSVKLKLPKKLPYMQAKARTGYYARNE